MWPHASCPKCKKWDLGFDCVSQELFRELVVRSAQKASAESAGLQILQLTESEAPGLRRRLAQLEKEWTNLSSMLPTLHQTQQQVWIMSSLSFHLVPYRTIRSKALARRYCFSKHLFALLLDVDKPASQSSLGRFDLLAGTCRETTGGWKLRGPVCSGLLWAV